MKRDLVHVLCCPDCKTDLALVDDTPGQTEVDSGGLVCRRCTATFPIVRGVPRFVSSDRHVHGGSNEWNRWNRVRLDIANGRTESEDTFAETTSFTPADLRGKLVLEVGCGAGRFLDVASRWGANVIGIDGSHAVEASQQSLGRRPNVSVIQADVFRLPFREKTFDAIVSIGVLHHSRDTREAFLQLPPVLKEGGDLAVWLCYDRDRLYNAASDFWRAVMRWLPPRAVYAWSWLVVTLCSWLSANPSVARRPWGHLRRILPVTIHPDRQWRILETFDWYSQRYRDTDCSPARVLRWCREGGVRDVRVLGVATSIRGRRDTAGVLPLVRWSIPDLRAKRVLVFGAGAAGRHAVQLLRHIAPGCVMGVADNDRAKEGLIIEDRSVTAFENIPRDAYDVVVIASLPGRQAIAAQLEAVGLVADRDYLAADRVEHWYSCVADDEQLAA